MTRESEIDFEAVYRQLPVPVLLLTPEFAVADANLAFLRQAGRKREDLLGRNVFDVFPDNPSDPGATGVRDVSASLLRVVANGAPDVLSLQKYDVEVPGSPGVFARRYWNPVNAPVFSSDGRLVLIASYVEEITDRVRRFVRGLTADAA